MPIAERRRDSLVTAQNAIRDVDACGAVRLDRRRRPRRPATGRIAPAEYVADLQPLLFSIAYRMLGSVSDAEDLVQEAFLRYRRAQVDGTQIDSPKAYLSAVVTRLAIDQLRAARIRRETYLGEWWAEPLLTDASDDPGARLEEADTLSMVFLLLIERLSALERAALLRHDVFAYGYDEIATIIGKSEDNTRQVAHRARRHIESEKARFDATRQQGDELAARFFAAVSEGDLERLVETLATDHTIPNTKSNGERA
jgi:RNA polymerase sigma-70 factor, ECF subfamily